MDYIFSTDLSKIDPPLIQACKKHPIDKTEIFNLIEQKTKLDVVDSYGNTALIHLSSLLAYTNDELNGIDVYDYDNGITPEFEKQLSDRMTEYEIIINKLITAGCNLNIKNEYGIPALNYICHAQHTEIANKMINLGVNVDYTGDMYGSALLAACSHYGWAQKNTIGFEQVIFRLFEKTNLSILQEKQQYNIMDYIYCIKSPEILNYLKLLFRNAILESITDEQTIISKSFHEIGDLNIVDIVVDFTY